jgi:hypothetical protein
LDTANASEDTRRAERSAHAIYGLVIITATLVADRQHATDAFVSLVMLWAAALVLVLAHTYSALVAELGQRGQRLDYVERHVLIVDNIPLATSVVLPTVLLVASGLGLISLTAAIDLSILLSLGSLFGLGAYQARRQGAPLSHQLAIGTLGGLLGIIIVLVEVTFSH